MKMHMRNSLVECKGLNYQKVFFFSLTIIVVPVFLSKADFSFFINSDRNAIHIPKLIKNDNHVLFLSKSKKKKKWW